MRRILGTNLTFFMLMAVGIGAPFLLGDLFSGMTMYQNMIITEVIYVVTALAVTLLSDKGKVMEIQQGPVTSRMLLAVIGIGLLVQPVTQWLNLFSMLFVENTVSGALMSLSGSTFYNLLYVAVAPAVAEEFVFRGLIHHGYRSMGVRKAAVLGGLVFGLMHLNINQFVYAFALGVLLALIMEASGSIYASMLVHFMVNTRSVIILAAYRSLVGAGYDMAAAAESAADTQIWPALLIYTPIALGCCIGIFFLLRRLAKHAGRAEYFDLVLQGQEQTVFESESPSAQEVRTYREQMEKTASQVLESDPDAKDGSEALAREAAMAPRRRAARFAPKKDDSLDHMTRTQYVLMQLPLWVGIAGGLFYMILIEVI